MPGECEVVIFELCMDCIFCIDLLMNFNLAIVEDETSKFGPGSQTKAIMITDRMTIARRCEPFSARAPSARFS